MGQLLGPQTVNSIDLPQKIVFVMSLPLHCDVIRPLLVPTLFVYFFVSVQPLSTNLSGVVVRMSAYGTKGPRIEPRLRQRCFLQHSMWP